MAITFEKIPTDVRVPGAYVEVHPLENGYVAGGRAVIIGQSWKGVTSLTRFQRVDSLDWANRSYGYGSMLARSIDAFRKNNPQTELWAYALADSSDGSVAAAEGTITFTGTSTEPGYVYLYVGGTRIQVAVAKGSDAASVAALVKAKIAKDKTLDSEITSLPVNVTVASNVVTFTAKNKGTWGNSIKIGVNIYGPETGEKLPAGLSAAVVDMSGGLADPSLTTCLAALKDWAFDYLIVPYNDSTSRDAVVELLEYRWEPTRAFYGMAIYCSNDAYADLVSEGQLRNYEHECILGVSESPTEAATIAGAIGGLASYWFNRDPARPLTHLPLRGVATPPNDYRHLFDERETLLDSGISTTVVINGTIRIERLISTFRYNSEGALDMSWYDMTITATIMKVAREFKNMCLNRFARVKLATDEKFVGRADNTHTPKSIRAEFVLEYEKLCKQGYCEYPDRFASTIQVERDESDYSRVNVRCRPNLVTPLAVIAVDLGFVL